MIVVCLLLSLCHLCCLLLLSLQSFHNFLSFFILVDHNIAYTKIGNDNSSQAEHIISIFVYNWLIISNSFIVSLKHKENMCNIKFPSLVIGTKLCTLSEKFLNNWVVLFIPIYFGLWHQDWDVLLETLVEFFKWFFDTIIILSKSSILDTFGKLSQRVNIPVGYDVQLAEWLFGWSFLKDNCINEFEILLIGHFICKLWVLS